MTTSAALDLVKQCRTIDAFVGPDAQGNPAGVLVLDEPLADRAMRDVARRMGHAETAFLVPRSPGEYDLRWFTPAAEVRLCGHATLASAWTLWNELRVQENPLVFHTLSGRLLARRVGTKVELDFPQDTARPWIPTRELLRALCVEKFVYAGRSPTTHKMLIELGDAETVRQVTPDFFAMKEALPNSIGGVIVTARGFGAYDFVSRYFHPWVGVDEDPATGSAHCLLPTHWSNVLGKDQFHAFQASARGGVLDVALTGTGRVLLRGHARAP
ncbi:MAG TPA: PhzF family phenazine biosynthesis protein [Candidatus Thermoplasmatota archaeon]